MSLNSALGVSVTVGDRELLSSGVVHLDGTAPVIFDVANLKFVFDFKTDEGVARYSGTMKENTLYIDLFNHKNALGEGLLTPLELAQVGGRAISITYYVSTVNADTNARRFEYAIYLGRAK